MGPSGARCGLIFLLFLTSLVALAPADAAAAPEAAYDSLEVGARYAANVGKNDFHEFWHPGQGGELFFATPFHRGRVWFGTRYLLNSATAADYPDFQSTFVYAGWSYPLPTTRRIDLEPGVLIGIDSFYFEDEQNAGLANETEAAAELFLGVGYRLRGPWHLGLTASSHVIFTHRRINLLYLSAGISRSFAMPGWLGGFLR